MISDEFYCPECKSLWDLETCLECGYEDTNVGRPRPKRQDKDGYLDRVQDKNKVRRTPREGKDV